MMTMSTIGANVRAYDGMVMYGCTTMSMYAGRRRRRTGVVSTGASRGMSVAHMCRVSMRWVVWVCMYDGYGVIKVMSCNDRRRRPIGRVAASCGKVRLVHWGWVSRMRVRLCATMVCMLCLVYVQRWVMCGSTVCHVARCSGCRRNVMRCQRQRVTMYRCRRRGNAGVCMRMSTGSNALCHVAYVYVCVSNARCRCMSCLEWGV